MGQLFSFLFKISIPVCIFMDDTNVSVHSLEMKAVAYWATVIGKQFWKVSGKISTLLVLHLQVSNNTQKICKF